jgi:hypothetical protein
MSNGVLQLILGGTSITWPPHLGAFVDDDPGLDISLELDGELYRVNLAAGGDDGDPRYFQAVRLAQRICTIAGVDEWPCSANKE